MRSGAMYHGRIGALDFTFCHATVGVAPVLAGSVIGFIDEIPIQSLPVGPEWYLIIDYRPDPSAGPIAYIEWWRPVGTSELPVRWLVLLTTASAPAPDPATRCHRCAGEQAARDLDGRWFGDAAVQSTGR
jgi:hypothetical protein